MIEPIRWFADGGPAMFLVLGLDVILLGVGLILTLVAAASRYTGKGAPWGRWLAVLGLLASLLPAGAGAAGWALGRHQLYEALAYVEPEHHALLTEAGLAAAAIPLKAGLGSTVPLALWMAVVIAIAPGRNREPEDAA